jgi:saccharopine dehydrogenase-like NADP-dependent oxidoreductase
MKIIVLGAGLIGTPMAIDLAKDSEFTVSVADLSSEALSKIGKQHSNLFKGIYPGRIM